MVAAHAQIEEAVGEVGVEDIPVEADDDIILVVNRSHNGM